MAMLIRELINKYNYIVTELSDKRTHNFPLIASPLPVLSILIFYVYFVKNLGPRLIKDRFAFKLYRIIQIYDVIQVLLALWSSERALVLGWATTYSWRCQPIDLMDNPTTQEIVRIVYAYFLIKMLDLLDTVFFVLRKKNNQITFLHIYHHTCMIAAAWTATKYLPGGHVTFVGLINSIVHAVMYTYYLVSSIYPKHKNNIWWKKYITQMQMVQFLMIILHSGQVLFQPDCQFPIWVSLVLVPQNSFMLAMFYDFYGKAYGQKKAVTSNETLLPTTENNTHKKDD